MTHLLFNVLRVGGGCSLAQAKLLLTRALVVLLPIASLAGCALAPPRNAVPLALVDKANVPGLHGVRFWGDEVPRGGVATLPARLPNMGRFAIAPKRENGLPVVNHLAISGGGRDKGAFGAGLLTGWTDARTRPPSKASPASAPAR